MPETDRKDQSHDPGMIAGQFVEMAEQSQRAIQAFWRRQVEESGRKGFSLVDPDSVGMAFAHWTVKLIQDPGKLAAAQASFWQDQAGLWRAMMERAQGHDAAPVIEPERGDRRFKDAAWDDEILYDYLKQSYLLSAKWLRGVSEQTEGLDEKERERVDFYTCQFISAISPSNFAMTNPSVLNMAKETRGQNLVDGLKRLLADLEKGKGRLKVSMTGLRSHSSGQALLASACRVGSHGLLRAEYQLRKSLFRLTDASARAARSGVARPAISISSRRMSLAMALPGPTPLTVTIRPSSARPIWITPLSPRSRTTTSGASSGRPAICRLRSCWSDQNQGTA